MYMIWLGWVLCHLMLSHIYIYIGSVLFVNMFLWITSANEPVLFFARTVNCFL